MAGLGWIHEREAWTRWRYDATSLTPLLTRAIAQRHRLFAALDLLGLRDRDDATLSRATSEVLTTSAIEGEHFDHESVRSSVAYRLGLSESGAPSQDPHLEGVVAITLDATSQATRPLTHERLWQWHRLLFPTGRNVYGPLVIGAYRTDEKGPMQIVSGPDHRPALHYEAPPAERVNREMDAFLDWVAAPPADPLMAAGIAHLWFELIHPFEDGNGRIGRALLDTLLTRADGRELRGYSVSARIARERKAYYHHLQRAGHGDADVTEWLTWFLGLYHRALLDAYAQVEGAHRKARFWSAFSSHPLNERQRTMMNRVLTDWTGDLTSKKWQRATDASDATASRDLSQLTEWGMLERSGEGRGVRYRLPSEYQPAEDPNGASTA